MAVAYVQGVKTPNDGAYTQARAVAVPAAQAGSLLVALIVGGNALDSIASVTDNKGNVWTKRASRYFTAASQIWTATAGASGNTTVTATAAIDPQTNAPQYLQFTMVVREYSGVNTGSPIQAIVNTEDETYKQNLSTTITPAAVGNYLIGFAAFGNGTYMTAATSDAANVISAPIGDYVGSVTYDRPYTTATATLVNFNFIDYVGGTAYAIELKPAPTGPQKTQVGKANIYRNITTDAGRLSEAIAGWFKRYVRYDGAVVRPAAEGNSDYPDYLPHEDAVSEGQAYAEIFAVQINDRITFDKVEQWTYNNLDRRNYAPGDTGNNAPQPPTDSYNIMAYHYNTAENTVYDWAGAFDADIDRAKALIWAHNRWGSAGTINYLARAQAIIKDMDDYGIRYGQNGLGYLVSGSGNQTTATPEMNNSYMDPSAFQLFADYGGYTNAQANWTAAIAGAYDIIQKTANAVLPNPAAPGNTQTTTAKLPANWVTINLTTGAVTPLAAAYRDTNYTYDAFRQTQRLRYAVKFNGSATAQARLNDYAPFFNNEWTTNGKIWAEYFHDGSVKVEYENRMFYYTAYLALLSAYPSTAAAIYSAHLVNSDMFAQDTGGSYFDNSTNNSNDVSYYGSAWMIFSEMDKQNFIQNIGVAGPFVTTTRTRAGKAAIRKTVLRTTTGRARIQTNVPTQFRYNLVPNPSYEYGIDGVAGSAAFEQATIGAIYGTKSLKVTSTSSFQSINLATKFPVVPGEVYSAQIWVTSQVGHSGGSGGSNRNTRLYTRFYDNTGAQIAEGIFDGSMQGVDMTLPQNGTRLFGTKTVPANAVTMSVQFYQYGTGDAYYDGAIVEKGSTLNPYFDGDMNGTWTGTPGNSTSSLPINVQLGAARIDRTITSTITGRSRIATVNPADQLGVARINSTASVNPQLGRSAIEKTTLRTTTGRGRLAKDVLRTITGRGRIGKDVPRTISGVGRILIAGTTTRNTNGQASLSNINWQPNTIVNPGFENGPSGINNPTTNAGRFVDGTMAGSTTDPGYGGWAVLLVDMMGSVYFDPGVKRTGNFSLRLANLNTSTAGVTVGQGLGTGFPSTSTNLLIPIEPTTSYQFRTIALASGTPANAVYAEFRQYDAAGNVLATTATPKIGGTTDWTELAVNIISDPKAKWGRVFLRNNVPGTINMAYFDNVSLRKSGTDQPGMARVDGLSFGPNLIPNPGFEAHPATVSNTTYTSNQDYVISGNGNDIPNSNAAALAAYRWMVNCYTTTAPFGGTYDTTEVRPGSLGTTSMKFAGTNVKERIMMKLGKRNFTDLNDPTDIAENLIPLKANTEYHLGFWYKTNVTSFSGDPATNRHILELRFHTAVGLTVNSGLVYYRKTNASEDWTYAEYTFVTPPNTQYVNIGAGMYGNTTHFWSGNIWFDDMTLRTIGMPQFGVSRLEVETTAGIRYATFTNNNESYRFTSPWSFVANVEGAYILDFYQNGIQTTSRQFYQGTSRLDVNLEQNSGKLFVWFVPPSNVGVRVYLSNVSVSDGKWHRVLVNKSSTAIDVWLDGEKVGTYATTDTTRTNTTAGIGRLSGGIRYFKHWNRGLTDAEALMLFANQPVTSGLISDIPFTENGLPQDVATPRVFTLEMTPGMANEPLTGMANIIGTTKQNAQGAAVIEKTTTRNTTGRSSVRKSMQRLQTGRANITVVSPVDQPGVASITTINTQDQSGVANIGITYTKDLTGKTRIQREYLNNFFGKSRIMKVNPKTQTGTSRIVPPPFAKPQTGRARIRKTVLITQFGRARISNPTPDKQPQLWEDSDNKTPTDWQEVMYE